MLLLLWSIVQIAKAQPYPPVNLNATQETRQLLAWLYEIQGDHTLSGLHNYVSFGAWEMDAVYEATGRYPAVFGTDLGFSNGQQSPGDCACDRTKMLDDVMQWAGEGCVISLMWHTCRPIDEEPCTWSESVQANLSDVDWDDLLTPGTPTYNTWAARMDTAALYLKVLEDARIPVLWRPWHEMNGGWFWWGGDPERFIALWRQTFDYLTDEKQVNNLIWVWGPNQYNEYIPDFAPFYPGDEYVDMLGADFYQDYFPQQQYQDLLEIGSNRLIAITETGFMPTPALLDQQPNWAFTYLWVGRSNDDLAGLERFYNDSRVLTADEVDYLSVPVSNTGNMRRPAGSLPANPVVPFLRLGAVMIEQEAGYFDLRGRSFLNLRYCSPEFRLPVTSNTENNTDKSIKPVRQ
jgi:mannan endo-1,4-beta-mannosidase